MEDLRLFYVFLKSVVGKRKRKKNEDKRISAVTYLQFNTRKSVFLT